MHYKFQHSRVNMILVKMWCLIVGLLNLVFIVELKETVEVETSIGTLQGYVRSFEVYGKPAKIRRFLGIPYAEPPMGELRFQKPKRKERLNGVHDATHLGAACLQLAMEPGGIRKPPSVGTKYAAMSANDCLFLNVYVPVVDESRGSLPVMVYIHGGGFVVGSSSLYPGDFLAVLGNVIVVTINYRVGIFGFLSTGDSNMPGNYGLFDQHMALSWIHEHIAAFGGDPKLITIFGASAGGASVMYQTMFPGNQGLFKRAIPQSGSIQNPWAFQPDPLKNAKQLGELVGCDDKMDTMALAQCLRGVSDEDFMTVYNDPKNNFRKFPLDFVVTVDGEFVPEAPLDVLHGSSIVAKERQSLFQSYDVMTGLTSMEGLMMITSFVGVDNSITYTTNRLTYENELIPEILRVMFGGNVPDAVRKLVTFEYTDWSNRDDDESAFYSFMKLSSDYVFNFQTIDITKLHAEGSASQSKSRTFLYLYDAISSQQLLPTPPKVRGAQHANEYAFLFGYDSSDEGFTAWTHPYGEEPEDWEIDLSKKTIVLWSNFAKSGNPNEPEDIGTVWPEYSLDSQLYFNISREFSVGQRLFDRAHYLWSDLLPYLVQEFKVTENKSSDKVDQFCDKDGICDP